MNDTTETSAVICSMELSSLVADFLKTISLTAMEINPQTWLALNVSLRTLSWAWNFFRLESAAFVRADFFSDSNWSAWAESEEEKLAL